MLYVRRNEKGEIVLVSKVPEFMADEVVSDEDPEVAAFINKPKKLPHEIKSDLESSDVEMVRVLEDLIELLIRKNVIIFTELPIDAQRKILDRKKIRDMLDKLV